MTMDFFNKMTKNRAIHFFLRFLRWRTGWWPTWTRLGQSFPSSTRTTNGWPWRRLTSSMTALSGWRHRFTRGIAYPRMAAILRTPLRGLSCEATPVVNRPRSPTLS